MPRTRLIGTALLGLLAVALPAAADNPHLDRARVAGGCAACHAGHGTPGSPMLPAPVNEGCLACHDSKSRADTEVRAGRLATTVEPPLLGSALSQPSVHPMTDTAMSRFDPGAVTCTSCHSPHRRSTPLPGTAREGTRRISTKDPQQFEFELCGECHGAEGARTTSLVDVGRQFDPNNASSHPVRAPSIERSPSLRRGLQGKEINCSDCHGASRRDQAQGPHGSLFAPILRDAYRTTDGAAESSDIYPLCYSCHDRKALLDESSFPLHRLHVVDERTACATCHSAHGSVENRALIRFGEETTIAGVTASPFADQLAYLSDAPGSGLCFLSCHGVDHAPKGYGADALTSAIERALSAASPAPDTFDDDLPAPPESRTDARTRRRLRRLEPPEPPR